MSVTLIFVLLVFVLFGFLLQGVNKGLEGMQHTNMRGVLILVSLGSLGWLLGLALLAHQEFFRDWGSLPPKLLLAPGVPMLLLISLLFTKSFTRFVQGIPRVWAVQLQVFRVIVEFILWRLFLQGKIPEQMTFEGLNFDVITGLTALPVAYFCFRKQSLSPKWALYWNYLGLILVTTIVVISFFSTPTPLRLFMNDPANTLIAKVPYIWLPGFVVPMAYFLHFVSIRQLRKGGK